MEVLNDLLNVALVVATLRTTAPILLVALGGSFTTKAGIFNIGLEGPDAGRRLLRGDRLHLVSGSPWIGMLCGVAARAGARALSSRCWSSPSAPTRSWSAWRSTSSPAA